MVFSAEISRDPPVTSAEQYGHSLSTLRRWGGIAVQASNQAPEIAQDHETLAYDDFESAVAEMLKTDPEFSQQFDINHQRRHEVIDNQVRAADGTAMLSILASSADHSRRAANSNPALEAEAVRDNCDLMVAGRVDALVPGQTWWGVSFYPKQALQDYPEIYRDQFGYQAGLVYIQTYSKLDHQTLIAGSFSIDMKHETTWRKLLAERGMKLPETATSDQWLLHGQVVTANPAEAKQLAQQLRNDCYQTAGNNLERQSISRFVTDNRPLIRQMFTTYYSALAAAVYSGRNQAPLRELAGSLVAKGINNLKPEISRSLIRIAFSDHFDNDAGRVLDSVIRYAVTEELRKGVTKSISRSRNQPAYQASRWLPNPELYNQQLMHNLLAANVQTGVSARRVYGGCPGQIELSLTNELQASGAVDSRQAVFGGKSEWKRMSCPFCGDKNQYGDVCSPNQHCTACQARVASGKVVSRGNGGKKDQQLAKH